MNNKIICIKCGYEDKNKRKFKKLNSGVHCNDCARDKRKKRRDYLLHEVAGVRRRSTLEKEWKKKREERKINKPKIKSIVKERPRISSLGIYLTKQEKDFLYYKYRGKGFHSLEANRKVKEAVEHLNNLIKKLRAKHKEDKEISKVFKEEFAKLCG